MVKIQYDPRLRFAVILVIILGVIILALVALLVVFGHADKLVPVILAAGGLLTSVLAVALGHNVLARFRDRDGRSGELKTTVPRDI